ncbi:hypothetical protein [Geothrix mesophila]|uniref:hypothetical protein n=1 Tax=Geothrix mesophila TaxID=2922723 RepID=UPI001FAD9B5A|nr:hypothetical protein [Geothrix sp. SG198]
MTLTTILRRWAPRTFVLLPLLALIPRAEAMPNWARKYSADCSMCHTTVPALNETGYDFRKAGFRLTSEIYRLDGTKASKDAPAKTTMDNAYTARIQARYDSSHTDTGTNPANNQSTNQTTFFETTFYPISGSFGKYLGSLVELSLAPGDVVETENAYLRFTAGDENSWFNARIGVFHPFEGYGASDRPFSIDRPFMQTSPAKSSYFKPWGFDQAGVEASYVYKRTTISLTMFNGVMVHEEDGALIADPAQGGSWSKKSSFKNYNTKDYQLFLNQILDEKGSGVSLYYYTGTMDQPIPGTAPDAFAPATSYENKYTRTAVYASWVPTLKAQIRAGYQVGKDKAYLTGATYKSKGYFGELASSPSERLTVGARYDRFQPTDVATNVDKSGITAYANIPFNDGFQLIAQYQNVTTQQGVVAGVNAADKKENKFQIRFIWIY